MEEKIDIQKQIEIQRQRQTQQDGETGMSEGGIVLHGWAAKKPRYGRTGWEFVSYAGTRIPDHLESVCLYVCLPMYLSIPPFVCLSIILITVWLLASAFEG